MTKYRGHEPQVPSEKYRYTGAQKSSAVLSSYFIHITYVAKIKELYPVLFSILVYF